LQQRTLAWATAALALIGLGISTFLTWYDIVTPRGVCSLTGFFGCSEILTSQYSRIGGVPTAFVGALWFIVVLWLAIVVTRSEARLIHLLAWSLLAIPGVGALGYIELVVIGAICPFCTSAHVLGLAILVLAAIMWRNRHR
jgi:uncharacterized membrane protein